ncbi:P-type conjugative transfer protein TrbL [Burkholderia cenocepacia]|uniref:P-type conjugative transfer protein TrbL n=1 Tax=Burkholderia cenocepacia TaxID=95486 RepID=UPI0013DF8C40|nr:P-type conjugative transfer protein TrbL [Burkholderia cenocepacia]MCW3585106.1 P-type conjugative transfer protein TrbL [Burkholderia cenocepacia]MCW3630428.1 P-type conjugative transfer protein TrbL [Burkholderia cenocepacia]MCW5178712.1 P-type conjugative transfer protein TrbL [Burkholderia cenocepacia]NGO96555.1 P-type conjugative transfer protein TrbL [Burkholderia cenocepacia]
MLAILKLTFRKPCSVRQWLRFTAVVAVVVTLLSLSLSALAQSSGDGYQFNFLNGVDAKFSPLQVTWGTIVKGYAQKLFWMLATIDFGWTTVTYILDKAEFADILNSLVKKVMTIAFFWTLLKMSDTWIPAIINSFKTIGVAAGGAGGSAPSASTPDGIVSTGFDTALAAYQAIGELGVMEKIAVVIPVTALAILVFLSFLFVAAQLLVTQIESYIAIGGGVILLGFGGSRWTTDMASKYLQYAVATGIKLMVLYMIVGAGQTLFDNLAIDPANLIQSCLIAAGEALVYAYLGISVPQMASAMMSGSPSMTAGGMLGAAIGAGAAVAGAGAAAMAGAAGAARGATGAAAGATGLAKALGAGLNSGLDLGKSGTALATHALGEMGSHGLGLAKGAIGEAAGGARTNFAQKVDGSAGGKIASSIEATRGGSVSGIPVPPSAPASSAPAQSGGDAAGAPATNDAGAGAAQPAPSAAGADMGASAGPAVTPVSAAVNGSVASASSAVGSTATTASPPVSASSGGTAAGSAAGASPTSAAPSSRVASAAGASPVDGGAGSSSGSASAPAAPSGSPGAVSTPVDAGSSASPGASATSPSGAATPGGDGSTASVSGDNKGQAPNRPGSDPLHKRINDLQGYVPQDAAHAASINIDLKHTAD